ncbi:hypothetical protein AAEX28_05220 [Lentisphaerota bacterium WC36G]|nr:arylsulfotransferase family protein [Lentisphaerae bacterium WC36]
MKKYLINILLIILIFTIFKALNTFADKVEFLKIEKTSNQKILGKNNHKYILATGQHKTLILNKLGDIVWAVKTGNTSDVWMLKNGNVLIADGEVKEVNLKTGEIIFNYKAKMDKGGGVYSCQRLENGNTLIGENSTSRILEVDSSGKIIFELAIIPRKIGDHLNLRMVRKTKAGNYLVSLGKHKLYREYDATGKILWEKKIKNPIAFSIIKLSNDNYLTGQINDIIEYDKHGKEIWKFSPKDIPQVKLGKICGINVLKNGNIVVGFYRSNISKNGAGLIEITRDKRLVWRYVDINIPNKNMMSVQVLNENKNAISDLK